LLGERLHVSAGTSVGTARLINGSFTFRSRTGSWSGSRKEAS